MKRQRNPKDRQLDKRCQWICEQLRATGTVNKNDFLTEFKTEVRDEKRLMQYWGPARQAASGALKGLGCDVESTKDQITLKSGLEERQRYQTPAYQLYEDRESKEKIGESVALYLKVLEDLNLHALLGSGTTVHHVGRQMWPWSPYHQQFWSINVPLIAEWCEFQRTPTDKVSVPGGTVSFRAFRFSSVKAPDWKVPIAIVGADGCYFDSAKDMVFLFEHDDDIRNCVNTVIQNATDSVIVCISSKKLALGTASGPFIEPPAGKEVKRFLVTNRMPEPAIMEVLQGRGGWKVVTQVDDWKQHDSRVEARKDRLEQLKTRLEEFKTGRESPDGVTARNY